MARQTLESWVAEILKDEDKGECCLLTLVHLAGTAKHEVHSIRPNGARKWSAQEIASLLNHKANANAQDLPGVQSYVVNAYYGSVADGARPEVGTFFPIRINPQPIESGLATEGAHSEGMAMQAMRHSEVFFQMSIRQTAEIFQATQATLSMLVKQNSELMAENHDAFVIVKELLAEKSTEDHLRRMKEIEARKNAERSKQLMAMVPALANTITGKEIFPQSSGDTALIENLAEGLSKIPPEKLMGLAEVVPPELLGPLMARANEVLEKKKKDSERSKEIVQSFDGDNEMVHEGSFEDKAAQ